MNDERAVAAAIHAGLQGDGVTDLYTGDCRGCGECCSRFLPVSPFDRVRLEAYVRRNGIEPAEPRAEYDLLCPYLTGGRECAVYAAGSCGGDNQRRKNGWKDCQFPSFQIGPPRISINPWQFEGFLTPVGEYGRITTRRGA